MAWMSAGASRLVGPTFVDDLTRADLIPELGPVATEGWIVVDEAVLLKGLYESYSGDRSRFPDVLGYEVAVNGRGIPRFGLPDRGVGCVPPLLRWGTAFAWAALHQQHRQFPGFEVMAYVSVAELMFDPGEFSGNVTFCTKHPGGPVWTTRASAGDDIVISLSTADCHEPLPDR